MSGQDEGAEKYCDYCGGRYDPAPRCNISRCLREAAAEVELKDLRAQLAAAKAEGERVRDALAHMQHCRSCAEGSWEDCEGGRLALTLLVTPSDRISAALAGKGGGDGWVSCSERMPEREAVDYYGDRYSIPVMLNTKHAKLFRWDFRNDGWVEAGWCDGPSPGDYRDWKLRQASHWHAMPTPPATPTKE